jgi:hypothetical protein
MSLINLVHPKLLFFYLILIGTFAYSQSPNGITTSEGDYFNISLCEGDFVTFTLDPFTSAPTTGEEYIFYRIRSGVGTVNVQLQSTSNIFTMTASATGVTGLQNGDKIYGRRINNNVFPPQIIDSDVITVSILSSSSTSTLEGGVINQQISFFDGFNLSQVGMSAGISFDNFEFGVLYNFPIRNINKTFAASSEETEEASTNDCKTIIIFSL